MDQKKKHINAEIAVGEHAGKRVFFAENSSISIR